MMDQVLVGILGVLVIHKDLRELRLVDEVLLLFFLVQVGHAASFPIVYDLRCPPLCGNVLASLRLPLRSIKNRYCL